MEKLTKYFTNEELLRISNYIKANNLKKFIFKINNNVEIIFYYNGMVELNENGIVSIINKQEPIKQKTESQIKEELDQIYNIFNKIFDIIEYKKNGNKISFIIHSKIK
ncbi:MAG: hypothetical protein ACTSPY_07030 [Candidatus Helarchaeota archaeon]